MLVVGDRFPAFSLTAVSGKDAKTTFRPAYNLGGDLIRNAARGLYSRGLRPFLVVKAVGITAVVYAIAATLDGEAGLAA